MLALILFYDLGLDFAGRQNRVGVLYYLMMLGIMSMIQISALAFSTGRAVLKKELMQGQYTPSSYFLGVTLPPDLPTILIMSASSIAIFYLANLNHKYFDKPINFVLIIIASL